ncbi:MAG: hypothetical protein Q8O84_03860, partial [Nanoarchaeota archaeon]|nr:hypothetical protein [Nanoarchaeota archaeon]
SYVKEKKQQSLLCKIRNHDVEVLYYDGNELMMLEKVIRIKWKNLFLSVLPLPHARNFYSMIGRIDKVSAIDTYLKRTKKT